MDEDVVLSRKFCETENLKYIDRLSKESKEYLERILEPSSFFKDFMRDYTYDRFNKINLGLATLVYNRIFYKDYKFAYNYVQDVHRMSMWRKGDIKIYLMEDLHHNTICGEKYVAPSVFLKERISKATDYVDLYLEIYTDRERAIKHYHYDCQIYKVGREFSENNWRIVNFNSQHLNSYPYVRVHRTDYRSGNIDNLCRNIAALTLGKEHNTNSRLELLKKELSSPDVFRNFITSIIDKDARLNKQINNIEDDDVKKNINFFKNKWLYNSEKWIDVSLLSHDKIKKILDRKDRKELLKLNGTICGYIGILMDLYTIARMFRKYNKKENKYSGAAKQIIYYAGNIHTRRVEEFIKRLGFEKVWATSEIQENDNYEKNCVDISGYDFRL